MRKFTSFWSASTLLVCSIATGSAATISINENGNGNINGTALPFTATGTSSVSPFQTPCLTYTLPFAGVAGNVLLVEPEDTPPIPGDVLQFNGNGTVIFYSKTDLTLNSLAERFKPTIFPFPVHNSVSLSETISGRTDGALYTPTAGQPGFDASAPTYHFISDVSTAAVPEPASVGMLFLGGAALLIGKLRRR